MVYGMTGTYGTDEVRPRLSVDAGRLWAGGLATALVAVLITVAGILVARGVFGASILAPKGAGVWGDASTAWYAFGAAVASLAATALMHVLILFTPRPTLFFGWVVALATVLAALAPFLTTADLASRVFTAGLNLVLGLAIGTLVAGTARGAMLRPQPNQEGLQPR
jgi:hypothetical protein